MLSPERSWHVRVRGRGFDGHGDAAEPLTTRVTRVYVEMAADELQQRQQPGEWIAVCEFNVEAAKIQGSSTVPTARVYTLRAIRATTTTRRTNDHASAPMSRARERQSAMPSKVAPSAHRGRPRRYVTRQITITTEIATMLIARATAMAM